MAANKRNSLQKAQDRLYIESLYLQGHTHREIAQRLSRERPYTISHVQVYRDIKHIVAQWVENRETMLDAALARELRKIDALESTAWDAWERSRNVREIRTTEQIKDHDGERTKAQIRREDSCGDPRYLNVVQWCIAKRCEILGINAPLVVQGEIATVAKPNLQALSTDELRHLRELVAKAGTASRN